MTYYISIYVLRPLSPPPKIHRFLYFLTKGIFFGFRKPVLLIPFLSINDFKVTSITSRSFNLEVCGENENNNKFQYEFQMIDYREYDNVADVITQWKGLKARVKNRLTESHSEDVQLEDIAVDEEEEDDEDYSASDIDDEVPEEYDSDHNSSSNESNSNDESDSEQEENDSCEELNDSNHVKSNQNENEHACLSEVDEIEKK